MIIAKNITKNYGKVAALQDVSFEIQAGESVALWGSNGAGKTTAIRCLLGVHTFQGSLSINGIDVQKHGKSARSLIGYVPQETAFYDLTVLETLEFYARLKKVAATQVAAVLKTTQLEEHQQKSVKALSGGMKQRLALSIALLADPPIMLLDEPTASLDSRAQRDFIHMIKSLNQAGKTIIFSSHRFEEVAAIADRVLLLANGVLQAVLTSHDLSVELGLRQWLRIEIEQQHQQRVGVVLTDGGYTFIPNGKAVFINISQHPKMKILALLQSEQITVTDFDVTDLYALPTQEVS